LYAPLEVLQAVETVNQNEKCDMWSAGVTFGEFVSLSLLYFNWNSYLPIPVSFITRNQQRWKPTLLTGQLNLFSQLTMELHYVAMKQ
jgi:hypothetical protein